MSTSTLGYARISTTQQSLSQQYDDLKAIGCERIFEDTMSGARNDRPGLAALLDYARPGDTIAVVALDRLGRDLRGIVDTIANLQERGIVLRSLREGVDSSTPVGVMIMSVFAALAQYERTLIMERSAAAREARRARGENVGRPKALTEADAALARRMKEAGETIPTIVKTLRVSRSTIYRALAA